MNTVRLEYSGGTILVKADGPVSLPYVKWDRRVGAYRIPGYLYRDLVRFLRAWGIPFEDSVFSPPPREGVHGSVSLYPFQCEALDSWLKAGCRGIIAIAAAGGKTFIGLKAIELLGEPTLILVPTLVLMDHWIEKVRSLLGVEAGAYGGSSREVKWITVSTYDSAYINAERLGNKFRLLIADEAHHIFAPSYSQIAEVMAAPFRMGLTCTPFRSDMRHLEAPRLIGDVIYEATHDDLAGKYVSSYVHKKIYVSLRPEEEAEYERHWSAYRRYLEEMGLDGLEGLREVVRRSTRDPEAREALLSRVKALRIAFNSEAKIRVLSELLRESDEKTIIFTLHNSLAYEISRRFLIPAITHQTPDEERRLILSKFRSGEYKVIVTSQVLNEGVDVPDASRGIILSGTGSHREYVQRLGRLLRKSAGDKVARLIEVVSRETSEVYFSRRRRRRPALSAPPGDRHASEGFPQG